MILFLHNVGPPAIIGTLKPEYTVREGQTVKLRCKVSGTKDSPENRTLTGWQKLPEGHYITDKFSRFKMRIGRYLKIKKVVLADQGTYVCIAHNAFGRLSREIKLVVEGKIPECLPIRVNGKCRASRDRTGELRPHNCSELENMFV